MSNRRSFTPEFKDEAVKLAIESKNISRTAREIGVGQTTLHKWVNAYRRANAEMGTNLSPADVSRVRELEKENAILRRENEFLKKAAAFFAKSLPM